jgi:hypothetical protein
MWTDAVESDRVTNSAIKRGNFVRLLNKRGAFEKEGKATDLFY